MINLIGAEKGGTGKTTISVNLAVMLANQNKDVLVIDTDKQGSASFFFQTRDDNNILPRVPCVQKFGKSLPKEILELASRYDEIIIDAGGRDSMELRYSMGVADNIYIPIRPAQFDAWTLEQMNNLIEQTKIVNSDLRAFVLINMASPNPQTTDAFDTKNLISDYENIKNMGSVLKHRIAFQRSVCEGLSVSELTPVDEKAQEEILSLYKELYDYE